MSLLNAIKGKIKDHGITTRDTKRRNPETLNGDLFAHTVLIERVRVEGTAEEAVKKAA